MNTNLSVKTINNLATIGCLKLIEYNKTNGFKTNMYTHSLNRSGFKFFLLLDECHTKMTKIF